jgi:outer membrane protein OmpA-like peptidoglycan-associated protein
MVMVVALLSITRAKSSADSADGADGADSSSAPSAAAPASAATGGPDSAQAQATEQLMQALALAVQAVPGVTLDARRQVIDFGDRARFQTGSHRLDADSARLLRQFVPQLLAVTQSELGRRWVHRVVVEGFADSRGDYLFNLNLSLQRAQRVLCSLLDAPADGSDLSDIQRIQVSDVFAVGGFSFNEQRDSLDASRRIELRIEFGPRPRAAAVAREINFGSCRLPM